MNIYSIYSSLCYFDFKSLCAHSKKWYDDENAATSLYVYDVRIMFNKLWHVY